MLKKSVYRARRQRLAARLEDGAVVLLPAAPERPRSRDVYHPYRQDSNLLYFCGFPEPQSWLMLECRRGQARTTLFCRERDETRELWDGAIIGPEAAARHFGLDAAYPLAELDDRVAEALSDAPLLLAPLLRDVDTDASLRRLLDRTRARKRVNAPARFRDLDAVAGELRLIKDAAELSLMQRAVDVAVDAHRQLMARLRPGMFEYEAEALLLGQFRAAGASGPSYPPICAAGVNACTLHYTANSARLRDGQLLLVDAGCEVDGYASDLTRTLPANGRFAGAARDLYQLVLSAQEAALKRVRAGRRLASVQQAAVAVLADGFRELGLIDASPDEIREQELWKRYYPHGIGHPLGLDVHDAGSMWQEGRSRKLEAGMVITIEPGCYVPADAEVPEAFRGIGIRIEDNVQVTASGGRVLSAALPRSIAGVEAAMAG